MEFTTSSLRECYNVENEIMEEMTHGTPSIIADGFARPAMMYLYTTMWDIRWMEMRHSNDVHVETRDTNRRQQSKPHKSYQVPYHEMSGALRTKERRAIP